MADKKHVAPLELTVGDAVEVRFYSTDPREPQWRLAIIECVRSNKIAVRAARGAFPGGYTQMWLPLDQRGERGMWR